MTEQKRTVGRPRTYTEDQRLEVIAIAEVMGTTAASAITGMPIASVFRIVAGTHKATPNELADFLKFYFKGREDELLSEIARYQLQ
ncbi:MAG: hypothetical protein ACRC2Y_04345 [Aeromonas veronii]